jgi:DNA invertase Pin-like site-specific DNA recombinase
MAQAGRLGVDPVLVIESLDRVSRLEPLEGLQRIIFSLVNAGVTIATVEDDALYTKELLNNDLASLLMLVVKIQQAHEYSKRLSRRIKASWKVDCEKLASGKIIRPRAFKTRWLDYSDEKGFTLNEYAEVVRRVFTLVQDHGLITVARILNEEGLPALTGGEWIGSSVRYLVDQQNAVYGSISVYRKRNDLKTQKARAERNLEELEFENLVPAVLEKEEVLRVRALLKARATSKLNPGPTGVMWYFGQGITYCTCGSRCGVYANNGGGKGKRYYYVRCHRSKRNKDCPATNYRLDPLHFHLITRMQPEQLNQLASFNSGNESLISAELKAVRGLEGTVALREKELGNVRSAFRTAVRNGQDGKLFADEVSLAIEDLKAAEVALSQARGRLAQLEHRGNISYLTEPVRIMRKAFLDGESTPEQRRDLNTAMRRLGIRIILDADSFRVAMAIGHEMEPLFQPLDDGIARIAMGLGLQGVTYRHQGDQTVAAVPLDRPQPGLPDDLNELLSTEFPKAGIKWGNKK